MIDHNHKTGRLEFALLLDFLGETATRIGETMKLHWSDIDAVKTVVDRKGGMTGNPFETVSTSWRSVGRIVWRKR